ncbi:MAG: OmpA family protein [Bacteroidetes bacterium]|jgi:outer membrane protein OmpA-like peptidoglycan-associated protein/tetratricopeptide (TPR) repeat protein|nr:OmpA family protein [Bacteroidota bacterium]
MKQLAWGHGFAACSLVRCLLLALLLAGTAVAQKPSYYGIKSKKALEKYETASLALRARRYETARQMMEEALALEPGFAHAHFQLGYIHYELIRPGDLKSPHIPQAIQHLSQALALRPGEAAFGSAHLWLAELYTGQGQYVQARQQAQSLLALPSLTPAQQQRGEQMLKKLDFAVRIRQDSIRFEPRLLGSGINSPGDEYMPQLTADEQTLFFTSRREGNLGGYDRLAQGYNEDFYWARRNADGSWQTAVNLGPPINTDKSEGAACFSQDGQWVYFTGCSRRDGEGSCDLYVARLIGQRWTEPQNMSAVLNSPHWDSQPCLSPDGQHLYFVSNRPGGLGGHDIWYSQRTADGSWMPPNNLGAPINTPGDEFYPFLAADGQTLYFSSDYHPGAGGIDLFMASLLPDSSWSEPRNLGYPLNTEADEQALVVNTRGEVGYIGTTRAGGPGGSDIYQFVLDERIRPKPGTYVKGRVRNQKTGQPVQALIQFRRLSDGYPVRSVESNAATGEFLLSLPLGTDYAAHIEQNGYLFHSQHFAVPAQPQGAYVGLEIQLQPLVAGALVRLDNVFFEVDKAELLATSTPELQAVARFMELHPGVRVQISGHTDADGSPAYNLDLSQRRAEAVRTWLIQAGIAEERTQAKGYGEAKPVADNSTAEGRARNRRTEFLILAN